MNRKYPVNIDFFDRWSPALAYILGFTAADGCVEYKDYTAFCKGKRRTVRQRVVSWQLLDREPLETIKKFLCPTKPIEVCKKKHGTYLRFRLCGQEIVDRFMQHGIEARKSFTARVSEVPSEFMHHYLRGVFDGDGCVKLLSASRRNRPGYVRLSATFSSGSLQFLEDIQSLTEGGVISLGSGCYVLVFDCGRAFRLLERLYEDSESLRLTRKYDKWNTFLSSGQTYRQVA